MKKIFTLVDPKRNTARMIEVTKHEVRRYIKREQKKPLPKGSDYWDFDCRYGLTAEDSKSIHVKQIDKYIDEAEEQKLDSFYLEIIAKPAKRKEKPQETV